MRPVSFAFEAAPAGYLRTNLTILLICASRTTSQTAKINVFVLGLVGKGAENIIPAIELAAAESNELYGPRVFFNYSIYGARESGNFCDDYAAVISSYLGEFYYRQIQATKNSYFIFLPTGCSPAIVYLSELSREWNIPTISSAGTANVLRDKQRYPTLVCILPSKIEEYAKTFLALLRWYNWRTVTFICDLNTSPDVTDCLEFPKILRRQNSVYNVYDFTADLSQESVRILALTKAKNQSKIIVILGHMDIVRLTMVAAAQLGMANSNYVYITSLWYTNNLVLGSPQWVRNDSLNEIAQVAFQSLLIVTLSQIKETQKLRKFFTALDRRSAHDQIAVDYSAPNALQAEETRVYAIFAHAAFHAAAQMVNESLTTGADLSNGTNFVYRMRNHTFLSVEQDPFTVNSNGDRDATFTVLAYCAATESMEETLTYDGTHEYTMYPSLSGYVWSRQSEGSILSETLECGYPSSMKSCETVNYTRINKIAPVVLLCALSTFIAACMYLRYQHRKWPKSPFNLSTKYLDFAPPSRRSITFLS